jgi:hypothetical protein
MNSFKYEGKRRQVTTRRMHLCRNSEYEDTAEIITLQAGILILLSSFIFLLLLLF